MSSNKRRTTALPKTGRERARQAELEAQKNKETETPSAGVGLNLIQDYIKNLDEQEREKAIQTWLVRIVTVLGIVIAVLIVGALLWESVVVQNSTVAQVGTERITVAEFQERVRVERAVINQRLNLDFGRAIGFGIEPEQLVQQEPYNTWFLELTEQGDLLGNRVLDEMTEEVLIRAYAEENGISIDQDAVDRTIEEFFLFNRDTNLPPTETAVPSETPTPYVSPTPSPTPLPTSTPEPTVEATLEVTATLDLNAMITALPPTPTQTFEEKQTSYNDILNTFYSKSISEGQISEAAIRRYFEYDALLNAVQDHIVGEREMGTYVNARHILVATQEEADRVIASLEAGEPFAELARALSTDSGSGAGGGELDWALSYNYVDGFRQAVETAEIGEITAPVESEFGFHIIQVRAREERALAPEDLQRVKAVVFEEWLDNYVAERSEEIVRSDDWFNHVPTEPIFSYRPVSIGF